MWLFDDNNALATATSDITSTEALTRDIVQDILLPNLGDFATLPGLVIGELDLEGTGELLAVQDPNWKPLEDAVMQVPCSTCDRYTVALFFQPVVESAPAAVYRAVGGDDANLTGGFPDSLYPRALVVIDSAHADELFDLENNEALTSHDWSRQFSAWNSAFQHSNVHSNGANCALFNGVFWNAVLERQQAFDQKQPANPMAQIYLMEAFGWTLQASLNGLTNADTLLSSLYQAHSESLDDETLVDICNLRGFQYTGLNEFLAEVMGGGANEDLNSTLSNPGPASCSQCGTTITESARFCQECGEEVLLGPAFCSQCGAGRVDGARFCGECGKKF